MASCDEAGLNKSLWRNLFHFTTKKHVLWLVLALVCAVGRGLIVPILAIYLGSIFDGISDYGSHSISASELQARITTDCIRLVVFGAVTWVCQMAQFSLWVMFGELQAQQVREKLFDAFLHADLEWFETTSEGVIALLPRVQTHIRELQQAVSQPLGSTIQNLVAAIACLVLALYISWKLALVSIAAVPICAIIMSLASKKIQPSMEKQHLELTKASKLTSNAISSVESVKCLNGESTELQQYNTVIQRAARWYMKASLAGAIEIGCIHLMTFGMFVQGFWYGGHLVSRGELSAGFVLITFWACFQSMQAIEDIIPQLMILEKGRAAATFLKNVLVEAGQRCTTQDKNEKKSPKYCEGDIKFNNVTFAYPSRPDHKVLDNCSFFFPAGDMTFVVGKSGSGKSTITNLLMQFYEPSSGEVLIDGNLIGTLNTDWIRNNVTLVQQQSFLFNETIFKNIVFGSKDFETVTKEDILTGVKLARLTDTIESLPLGLDTVVGLHGNLLSGGQRQRVALARSRLRDTPILILDESTSALDHPSRLRIISALRSWRKGKTTIVITHDPSQIHRNDFVYVVDQGQVTRRGYKQILAPEAQEIFRDPATIVDPYPTPNLYEPEDERPSVKVPPTPVSPLMHSRLPPSRIPSSRSPAGRPATQSPLRSSLPFTPVPPRTSIFSDARTGPLPDTIDEQDEKQDINSPSVKGKQVLSHHTEGYISLSRIVRTVISSLGPRDRLYLILGFLCAVCHAAATPVFAYTFSQLLNSSFLEKDHARTALKWALAVLGISVANGIASSGMSLLLERCGQSWVDYLRYEAMRRILSQSRHWFEQDSNNMTRLVDCLDRKMEEIKNLIGKFAGFVLVAAVMIIMGLTWGAIVCWKLTLVGAGCAPVLYALTRMFDATSRKWEGRSGQAHEIVAEIFAETFVDIRTVRALTLESYFHRKHYKATFLASTIGLKRAICTGFLLAVSDASILFVYALVFYYGTVLVTSLEYSASDILTVFSMLLFSMVNVKAVLALIPQISSSRDNASQVLSLATLPEDASHEHRGQERISHPLPIKFRNVNFSYPSRPDQLVLQRVNFSIQENTCTAIIGASGSGKSTIASLLLSLYPVGSSFTGNGFSSGTITLGGKDIREIHVPTLRSLVTIVPQTPTLFPCSIGTNISYGLDESSPLHTMSNIANAARQAGIHEFISSLPSGYDTIVGDGGLGLSGGQIQRLAIARALVRQPMVLILDEATSNLDRESSEVIRQTIKSLMFSRTRLTVIIVAHAKEMMEVADHVLILEEGRIVDQGAPWELVSRSRAFLRLGMGLSLASPAMASPGSVRSASLRG